MSSENNKNITPEVIQAVMECIMGYTNGDFKSYMMQRLPDIPHHYSLDERVIGTWIDGKPLYEKTVVFEDIIINSEVSAPHTVVGYDKIFLISLFMYDHHGLSVTLPVPSTDLADNNILAWISNDDIHIRAHLGDVEKYTAVINLRYTKTADDASSHNPNMIVSNDYSYDEHIVGRWVDGKPLYEKTIDMGKLNKNSFTIEHNIENLDAIISIDPQIFNGDSKRYESLYIVHTNRSFEIDSTTIYFNCNNFDSDYNRGFVTLRYTKTTD